MSEQHDLTKAQTYTASNIEEREGLEAMRGTPTLFLSDLEHGGITHSALEVITNSNDELMAFPHANAKLIVVLCKDSARNSFQWVIQDTGRGMPYEVGESGKSVFVQCLTKPHTSGKFNQDSYTISGGQFGVGLKATTAMSRALRCLTHRTTGSASLTVRQGVFGPENLIIDETYIAAETGTTTVYEPDNTIFAGVETYAEIGYAMVISLLRQMVFFRFKNIEFRISETPVDQGFWDDKDLRSADLYINTLIANAPVIWDAKNNDPDGWIRSYWNLHRNFTWSAEIGMSAEEKQLYENGTAEEQRLRDVILKLYLVRGDRNGGVFALVNSVPIPNRGSDHVAVVTAVLKEVLSSHLTDERMKKFFMESYALPLFYAINVDYKGAKFSNAAKTDFKEGDFRRIYGELLTRWFTQTEVGSKIADDLYERLKEDIAQRYADSLGKKTQVTDTSRLWTRLNKYKNFIDASPPDGDRSSCEIILLEGQSTGGGEGGDDSDRKGIYFMQGKPCNALKGTHGDRNEVIRNMLEHEILSDIFTIINYDPRKPDLDKLYFGSGVIATDADPHGGHISALLFAAFQIISPELVSRGYWSVVVPPYYRITLGKNSDKRMYMRERSDLPQWCARHIFNKFFEVRVGFRADLNLPERVLDLPTLEVLTDIIFNYGLLMDNISAELSIPPELLEALCRCTHYLTEHTMNTEVIKRATMCDQVAYHAHTNLLVITYQEEDITIPLIFLRERLYGPVMRELNRVGWTLWQLYITTKRTSVFNKQPISLYHLYQVFKTTRDSLIEIEPLKGLGTMSGEDLTKTCLDVRNRKVIRITSLGDLQRTLNIMEKDSATRKQLGNSLSNTTLEL